MKKTMTIC